MKRSVLGVVVLLALLACKKEETPTPPAAPAAPAAPGAPATSPAGAYKAGDKVDVEWNGDWWQGEILQVDGSRYKVHYIGWESSWDEWVTTARLRAWTGKARQK